MLAFDLMSSRDVKWPQPEGKPSQIVFEPLALKAISARLDILQHPIEYRSVATRF
jgi:hypothetical protein